MFLAGKTIAVTRPKGQEDSLSQLFSDAGARVLKCPLISIVPCFLPDELLAALGRIAEFDWVCFTSANGVGLTMEFAKRNGMLENLKGIQMASIGSSTQSALEAWGFECALLPEVYQAESLFSAFQKQGVKGKRFLLLRAKGARELLHEALLADGGEVTEIPLYEAVPDREGMACLEKALTGGQVDCITLTSSSTVQSLAAVLAQLPSTVREQASRKIVLASIGPVTSQTLRRQQLTPGVEAKIFTAEGLFHAIEAHYGKEIAQTGSPG